MTKISSETTELTAISLFSGAGGLDVGFEQAGFKIVFANEYDHDAAEAWRINRPDIKQVMVEGDIKDHLNDLSSFNDVAILFGGPPCQGFSVAGKMDPADKRSTLVWSFLDAVEIVNPKIFVMENVAALASLTKWHQVREDIVNRGNALGYEVSYKTHHTPDYGVPENRNRVIFIGVRNDIGKTDDFYKALTEYRSNPVTAREVILSAGTFGSSENPQTCTANVSLASRPVMRRSPYAGMLVNGAGRPIDLDGIAPTLPASMGGNKTPIVDEVALHDANIPNWFSTYHAGLVNGMITPAETTVPSTIRRLTIKECAAIQTFPANYNFSGRKTKQYKQIGNAVPCRFAKAVAMAIRDAYFEEKKMAIEIDKSAAIKLLNKSYLECSKSPVTDCSIQETIDFVMHGKNCLTYRYILSTALLAKAVEPTIDILSLQARDKSKGAYDARSLAKDVVFQFQKTMLGNILDGANNDPLVNNPGRFERLSKDNPAAGGDPKKALEMLCDNLPLVQTEAQARRCVNYIVSLLLKEKESRDAQKGAVAETAKDMGAFNVQRFMSNLLDQGFGGSALVIVTTAIYHILYSGEEYAIVPHPVNQSGSSNRQFSDLDLFRDGKPFMGTELKDKPFTASDVDHAAETAFQSGASSLLFIAGRQSSFASQPPTYFTQAREKYATKGLYVGVTSIDSFMDTVFASHMDLNPAHVMNLITETAENIGALEAQMWIYSHMAGS